MRFLHAFPWDITEPEIFISPRDFPSEPIKVATRHTLSLSHFTTGFSFGTDKSGRSARSLLIVVLQTRAKPHPQLLEGP